MRFVFAPDSFKGSLSAAQVCDALDFACAKHFPDAQRVSVPVADGGEGTLDALLRAVGGKRLRFSVRGPLDDLVDAECGLLSNGTGVVEMAQASGLPLVAADRRDLPRASSYGTGELIARLLDMDVTELLIGIGGSATNDGGMGMLCALGARFCDADGAELRGCGASLARVASIDLTALHPALRASRLTVICDVTNPLLGATGATYIYGPQKGGRPETLHQLEQGMTNYARAFESMKIDIASLLGAGAAGGVGGALGGVLHAQLKRGIDAVLDAVDFDVLLRDADLVVTGEGRIDRQSVEFYKVPAGIAARCKPLSIPVVALVGSIGDGASAFYTLGGSAILPILDTPMSLEQAMASAESLIAATSDRLFRMLKVGGTLGALPPDPRQGPVPGPISACGRGVGEDA